MKAFGRKKCASTSMGRETKQKGGGGKHKRRRKNRSTCARVCTLNSHLTYPHMNGGLPAGEPCEYLHRRGQQAPSQLSSRALHVRRVEKDTSTRNL